MKKILVLLGAMVASQAFAADLCTGGNASKQDVAGGSGAVVASPTFIRNGFSFNCSNNVFLSYTERNATLLTVGTASAKGNQQFGGSSAGGAITAISKCSADPCAQGDAQAGDTAANTAAGSSS